MVIAKTVSMKDTCDKALNFAKKLVSTTDAEVRILGVTRCPDAAYVPVIVGQFEQDLFDAITKAQALVLEEFFLFRPISVIIEGRNFQGNASTCADLRNGTTGPNANRVTVVMGNDATFVAANSYASKYASVGFALGIAAAQPVQRNIGRVKNKRLELKGFGTPGFSNGAIYNTLTETNTDSLHDKGFVFFRKIAGLPGTYFNDDSVAAPITDDYSSLSAGRTMDKAARITRAVYVDDLLDDIELDPATGKLAAATIKAYQSKVEVAIDEQMTSNKEIVRVSAFADPEQNVGSTDQISIDIKIRRKGMARDIRATLSYEAQTN